MWLRRRHCLTEQAQWAATAILAAERMKIHATWLWWILKTCSTYSSWPLRCRGNVLRFLLSPTASHLARSTRCTSIQTIIIDISLFNLHRKCLLLVPIYLLDTTASRVPTSPILTMVDEERGSANPANQIPRSGHEIRKAEADAKRKSSTTVEGELDGGNSLEEDTISTSTLNSNRSLIAWLVLCYSVRHSPLCS